jgi:uncharacterized repeat protein (TIGR03803 family)
MRHSRFFLMWCLSSALLALVDTSSSQTVTTVYSFPRSGGSPYYGSLTQGPDGQLYGTTTGGGANDDGTVFKISTLGRELVVHSFDGADGSSPEAGVTLASDGYFYGAAVEGGAAPPPDGVIFKLNAAGSFQVLVNINGSNGSAAIFPPVEASDGNLYGVTPGSGPSATPLGTLYKISRSGLFSNLYTFDGTYGSYPHGRLVQGPNGNLYGVAADGANGCGTIFEFTLEGAPVSAYSFDCGTGGNDPVGAITLANDGNFYGNTDEGGTHGLGVVYKYDRHGVLTVLYNFGDTPTDSFPQSSLIQATDGNLYGTVNIGGTYNNGTIYQVTLSGAYTVIYNFPPGSDEPYFIEPGLMQHTNGKLYGESCGGGTAGKGTVFSLDMGLGPFVTFVSSTGKVGYRVGILGQGFTGTTNVTFNGVPVASFSVVSDTYMTTVVPSGATTGPVVVTTPGGALTSNVSFRIIK